jgi:tRNA splicing endonuclease
VPVPVGAAIAEDKYRRTKQKESDMTIDDIYRDLRGRGLVASLRRFSRDFLGRAENYAADRRLD